MSGTFALSIPTAQPLKEQTGTEMLKRNQAYVETVYPSIATQISV